MKRKDSNPNFVLTNKLLMEHDNFTGHYCLKDKNWATPFENYTPPVKT